MSQHNTIGHASTGKSQAHCVATQQSLPKATTDKTSILSELDTIEPRHLNAYRCLLRSEYQGMQEPSAHMLNHLTSAIQSVTTGINSFLFGAASPASEHTTEYVCQQAIEHSFQQMVKPGITTRESCEARSEKVINSLLTSDTLTTPAKEFIQNNPTLVKKFISKAIGIALKMAETPENIAPSEANLRALVKNVVAIFRHRAFINDIPWNQQTKNAVFDQIFESISKQSSIAQNRPQLLRSRIEFELYALGNTKPSTTDVGGKLKANKKTPVAILNLTQIRTASGKIYELINTPTPQQLKKIQEKIGYTLPSGTLGQGGFGKVRYAIDTDTQEIVAVKKMDTPTRSSKLKSSRADAELEVATFKKILQSKYTVQLHDYAHLTNAHNQNKSYLFMDLAADCDGSEAVSVIHADYSGKPQEFRQILGLVAKEYIQAIAEIHSQGNFHRDIKPDNFLHRNMLDIKIGDYGFMTQNNTNKFSGGTPGFLAPEQKQRHADYTAEKHDAFALGMSLLVVRNDEQGFRQSSKHLTLEGKPITLKFKGRNCLGLSNTHKLAGTTLDEVIAKLLAQDPAERISPREALALPFFK